MQSLKDETHMLPHQTTINIKAPLKGAFIEKYQMLLAVQKLERVQQSHISFCISALLVI